jgi:hypothetical protein
MIAATKFNWTFGKGRVGAKKVVILVGNEDAKPATINLANLGIPTGLGISEVANTLRGQGITVFSLQAGDADGGNLVRTLRGLASGTGGEFYPYQATPGSQIRTFASRIRATMQDTVATGVREGQTIERNTIVSAGRTFIPVQTRTAAIVNRLRDAYPEMRTRNGAIVMTDGWMIGRGGYEPKVLFEKSVLLGFHQFLRTISEGQTTTQDLVKSIRESLRGFLGENISETIEVQELLEKSLGVTFPSTLLASNLQYIGSLSQRDRREYQLRIRERAELLGKEIERQSTTLNRDGQAWIPVSVLP